MRIWLITHELNYHNCVLLKITIIVNCSIIKITEYEGGGLGFSYGELLSNKSALQESNSLVNCSIVLPNSCR